MNGKSIRLTHPTKQINGTVQLTGSKSESNRALIIQALSRGLVQVNNLSDAADTHIMQAALSQAKEADKGAVTIDIGPAGTAMRFLASYLNMVEGEFILTGTPRMQQRPIRILADALHTLGANMDYVHQVGYPPLRIQGKLTQQTERITIQGNVSSQYISSLLLIASSLNQGLTLKIEGELTSRPYVTMTLNMLQEAGITHTWTDQSITIGPQSFRPATIYVEPDWSAASYWYAIVALSDNGRLVLPGLKKHSLQGDMAIVDIMKHFGVQSAFESDGLHLTKTDQVSSETLFDFKSCPDLAQTIVALAAALKRDISITGVETLKIKETDRLHALKVEIAKFGAELVAEGEIYHIKTFRVFTPGNLEIATYEDHRMAMAFAPLAMVFPQLTIHEPIVVEKSYPDFWQHLSDQGFQIQD